MRAPPRRPAAPPPPPPPPPPRKEPPRQPKARKDRSGLWRFLGRSAALVAIWGGLAGLFVLAYFAHDLPDVNQAVQLERRPAVTLVAADGTPFHRFGDLRGATVQARDLPPHLINALLATEDSRFWSHFGIDPIGIARAALANWKAGRTVQGASTITQQLVKNLFLTPEQTMKRKAQEAILAVWLESKYSKEEILTAYLNRVYLGAGTFGVDAAARTYFDKPATELNLREAAIIVGLLKAPSRYAPTASEDKALQRASVVLAEMVEQGYIGEAERKAALAVPRVPKRKPGQEGDGRYFAAWVADQVAAFVGPDHGDLIVYTTFDPAIQRATAHHIAETLRVSGEASRVSQAAAVVMTPDGAVKALMGGRDYDDSQFNRATQALRQPGSAFKPIVYLAALEAGWSPTSTVVDAPYQKKNWRPANYDLKFRGEVSLRDALAWSLNTATIRLLEEVGVDRARSLAKRLGLTTPMRRDLSLALGTSEVTLLELTGAYATLANDGRSVIPYAIQEIRDTDGQLLYQRRGSSAGHAVAGPDVEAINQMLLAPIAYGTGTAARLDRMAAGKTGTTQDYKDAWFVGFTADLVAGVWLGNDDGAPMKKVAGGGLPAKLWRSVMEDAHRGLPPRPLPGLSGGHPRVATVAPPAPPAVAELPPEGVEAPAQGAAPEESNDAIANLIRSLKGE
ncbi:PBP1A family penicillin-binding protein [Aerophototrophica crusticola]|uniref:PBP1A family penicillin-binding protein n=1 Tax=Aerophototrophica crusticola TaxID=1709002 RepID=A0A858RBF0_9PROT|nr:PBP1A family penicillin-binding protein [Rhodospirillaceae bacterium B3]